MSYFVITTFPTSLLVTWKPKPEKMQREIIAVKMPLSSLYLLQILTELSTSQENSFHSDNCLKISALALL